MWPRWHLWRFFFVMHRVHVLRSWELVKIRFLTRSEYCEELNLILLPCKESHIIVTWCWNRCSLTIINVIHESLNISDLCTASINLKRFSNKVKISAVCIAYKSTCNINIWGAGSEYSTWKSDCCCFKENKRSCKEKEKIQQSQEWSRVRHIKCSAWLHLQYCLRVF